ncbi:MAG: desulfoferrodoxin [Phycisphaerae bacterium]|nr:desulfoferrodoxin [Phycisphaerae bacterium]
MTEQFQVYKCDVCGNIVEVLHANAGQLVCCGQPMTLQEPKTEDASTEKHVPYIEKIEGGYKVRVGQNAAHPMEEKHYIEWIELTVGDLVAKTYLKPGEKPEASFYVGPCCGKCGEPTAREYCNVHGLWKS